MTGSPFPSAAPSLHPLDVIAAIDAAVARAPDRIAVIAPDASLTYRALAEALAAGRTSRPANRASTRRIVPVSPADTAATVLDILRIAARGDVPSLVAGDGGEMHAAPIGTPMDREARVFVRVPDDAGRAIDLTERALLLRGLDAAVMHPALTRDTRSGLALPLASAQGIVALFAGLHFGATNEIGASDAIVDAIASGRIDQAWLGAASITAIDSAATLPAPPATFRLAVCAALPTPAVRTKLVAWLGADRVTAETATPDLGVVTRHPGLEARGEPAIGVVLPREDEGGRGRPRRLGLTIMDGIRASALARPDRAAVVIGERELKYRDLVDRMDRVASAAIADLRLAPGDRIAVVLPNCLEYLEIVCGFAAAGVPPAMMPPMAIASEIRFIVEDCGARVLICHASNEEMARAGAGDLVERVIVVGRDYDEWLSRARPARSLPPIAETDIFSIPYTSGATGKPKGILLSHRSRVLSAYAAAVEYRALGPDTRMLVSTPVFHGAGFLNLLAPCWFGGQAIILPRFSIEGLLDLVATRRITAAHMVPAHFAAYFALSDPERRRFDTSSLRSIVSGTAPLAQAMKEKIVDAFGADVLHERYGSTEASIVTNLRPEDQLRKTACVGQPFASVEVEIRDAAGGVLPPGATGELWSRSPIMFSGYWKRPEAEAATVRDGWVTAGDMAMRDEEGYVYLVDRKNDMIISGGENVYPREIEEVLMRHPAVAEVAVVGMPHEYWGDAVTAFVHLREGMNATPAELERLCNESLARWKVPKAFHVGGPLPRNSMGKILRREVKAAALARIKGARPGDGVPAPL